MDRSRILETVPQSLAHSAEEGANRIAEAVELAGARVAKGAGQVMKAGGQTVEPRADHELRRSAARLGALALLKRSAGRARRARPRRDDAKLRARLDRTTRELAHESSDLNAAIDSLNRVIRSNRRAARRGRTRLLVGAGLGAGLMYHLDADHGRQRRAATARILTGMARGERPPSATH